jgi:hypothetical protein
MSTAHAKSLEAKLKRLRRDLDGLANERIWEGLILTWRRPGWTTPAEVGLVHTTLDALLAQAGVMSSLKTALDKCSRAVKTSEPVAF